MAEPLTQLDANRLRGSLGTKLAAEAKSRGIAADPVRKQYIFTIFLSRIFQGDGAPWVLLGGNALLIRTGGGRFTKDIDLARETAWTSPQDALAELRQLSSRPHNDDPFEFDLYSVPTTPIENHLADKICALYERHGQAGEKASTRYPDLTDIVRIVAAIPFDAARLRAVLQREASRRRMTLPNKLRAPGEDWVIDFPRSAAGFAEYSRDYWDLNAALGFCNTSLDEILDGTRTSGTWDPPRRSWQ